MSRCIECDWTVKVNYSCYDDDVYICNDCEQEHYNWNYELYKNLTPKQRLKLWID